jgi:hypothetical protein
MLLLFRLLLFLGLLPLRPFLLSFRLLNSLLRLLPWLLNLGLLFVLNLRLLCPGLFLLQLLSLLLVVLNLRPLVILLLSFVSYFLSLLLRPRFIALDAPGPLLFPMSTTAPGLPVLLKSLVRNPLIVPSVTIPIMVPVVPPPAGIYVEIERWNSVIITPTPVIIMRSIPTPFP